MKDWNGFAKIIDKQIFLFKNIINQLFNNYYFKKNF